MAADSSSPGHTPAFVGHLTGCQSSLYVFISALLGGAEGAADVLQETNIVLWNKAGDYDPSRPFLPWAYTFARFQVMAWRKKQSRSRLVLDDELVARVADEFDVKDVRADRQLEALENCLTLLPPAQRELLDSRYFHGKGVSEIAGKAGRAENAIAANLYRIRKVLMECVKSKLQQEVGS
ncbi:MAG TPA: sigma-70 family RNA polymerase sigma factor [Luteolibacter sp.]|nr:sigma-70 family RNA polymerase sigma factor [Luteolibacter sp.]